MPARMTWKEAPRSSAAPSTAGARPVENTMAALRVARTVPRCSAPQLRTSRLVAMGSWAPMASPPPTISAQTPRSPPASRAIPSASA